jgi:ABC-type uncharacterized transport system YnjBCD ATPase subunit
MLNRNSRRICLIFDDDFLYKFVSLYDFPFFAVSAPIAFSAKKSDEATLFSLCCVCHHDVE